MHANESVDSTLADGETSTQTSKTQLKRAMLALQDLGEQLIDLPKNELDMLALPEKLLDAVVAAKKITHWGALKRQKQYIGRLMRGVNTTAIEAHLNVIAGTSQAHHAWLHRLEKLRTSLIADDQALQLLLAEHPNTDVQTLRTLIRNTRKEQLANKPPKHFRALFQMLKTVIPEPTATHQSTRNDSPSEVETNDA